MGSGLLKARSGPLLMIRVKLPFAKIGGDPQNFKIYTLHREKAKTRFCFFPITIPVPLHKSLPECDLADPGG